MEGFCPLLENLGNLGPLVRTGRGAFDGSSGIAINATKHVFVMDSSNHRVILGYVLGE